MREVTVNEWGESMKKQVISILVENHAGVLSKVVGLFSRRGFNIDSLAVGTTQDISVSRITIVVDNNDYIVSQLTKQLNKLIDVIEIKLLNESDSVRRELVLIKIRTDSKTRQEVMQMADIFRAKIVDVSNGTLTVEMTGTEDKISAFLGIAEGFGIEELVKTGTIAIERGINILK